VREPFAHPLDGILGLVLGGSQQLDGLHSHGGSRSDTGVRDSSSSGGDGGAQEEVAEALDRLFGLVNSELLHAVKKDRSDVTLQVTSGLRAVLLDVFGDLGLVDAEFWALTGSSTAAVVALSGTARVSGAVARGRTSINAGSMCGHEKGERWERG